MEEIKSLKDREKELLEVGKKQGYITYEVLAEHLKGLDIDADSLDELYNLLIENHIDIITDGRFEINKKDINLLFKGSSNQKTIDVQKSLKQNKIIEYNWKGDV